MSCDNADITVHDRDVTKFHKTPWSLSEDLVCEWSIPANLHIKVSKSHFHSLIENHTYFDNASSQQTQGHFRRIFVEAVTRSICMLRYTRGGDWTGPRYDLTSPRSARKSWWGSNHIRKYVFSCRDSQSTCCWPTLSCPRTWFYANALRKEWSNCRIEV